MVIKSIKIQIAQYAVSYSYCLAIDERATEVLINNNHMLTTLVTR